MEVLEFIKQKERMCDYHCGKACTNDDSGEICPAYNINCDTMTDQPEQLVAIVEQWAEEHPEKPERERQKPEQERQKPEHPEEAADVTKPKQDETCGIKPEDFVNHFIAEMLMRHEEQIEKLTQNVEELMKPVNAAEEPTAKTKRTNKDVLLASFPDAYVYPGGVPLACPLSLDKHYECSKFKNCEDCRTTHWPKERTVFRSLQLMERKRGKSASSRSRWNQ